MEIPEVPIKQPRKKKIRASRKVLAKTEQYLNNNGLSFDQLTPAQQTYVVMHFKAKRACLSFFPFALVLLIFTVVAYDRFYEPVLKDLTNSFMPDEYVVEAEDGSKVLKIVEEGLKEEIQMYGVSCAISAGLIIAAMYIAISGSGIAIGLYFLVRQERKVLDAFLPSVRTAVQSESSSNG